MNDETPRFIDDDEPQDDLPWPEHWRSAEPLADDDEVVPDDQAEFEAAEEDIPEPIPGTPPEPPSPESQSGFVNPAMARIAATHAPYPEREPNELWLGLRTIVIIGAVGLVVAFIFSYWTPDSFLSDEFVGGLQAVSSTQGPATALPSPIPTQSSVQKIGLITGHSGPPLDTNFDVDPGAICDQNNDGVPELTELSINTAVAQRVANLLIERGYDVEMLEEWDDRLPGYRASALVSIHTNTCENLGFGATGFNVQANDRNLATRDRDSIFADCMVTEYAVHTSLPRHFGSPPDLVEYHAFRKVSIDTPMVIMELGFMFSDRQILVERPDAMAQGIADGIDCFLRPSAYVPPEPTPAAGS